MMLYGLNFETYLNILSKNSYIPLIKFRTSNYRLPIETRRWENIPINERKCTICDKNDLGDNFYCLFICLYFTNDRIDLLKPYYYRRPYIIKYKDLLSSKNKNILLKLSKFVQVIMNKVS